MTTCFETDKIQKDKWKICHIRWIWIFFMILQSFCIILMKFRLKKTTSCHFFIHFSHFIIFCHYSYFIMIEKSSHKIIVWHYLYRNFMIKSLYHLWIFLFCHALYLISIIENLCVCKNNLRSHKHFKKSQDQSFMFFWEWDNLITFKGFCNQITCNDKFKKKIII